MTKLVTKGRMTSFYKRYYDIEDKTDKTAQYYADLSEKGALKDEEPKGSVQILSWADSRIYLSVQLLHLNRMVTENGQQKWALTTSY